MNAGTKREGKSVENCTILLRLPRNMMISIDAGQCSASDFWLLADMMRKSYGDEEAAVLTRNVLDAIAKAMPKRKEKWRGSSYWEEVMRDWEEECRL